MIIDGKELKFKCNKCGTSFKWIVGTGPLCPSSWLIRSKLKENPPKCPHCGSTNVKETLFSRLFG